jgi:hypothetical protein
MESKCGGRSRNGKPCGNPAGAGTGHLGSGNCKHHGGSTPSGRKSALEQQARLELARLNLPPVEDPLTQLAAVTAEVLAWKDAWAAKVNDLTSVRYEGTGAGEQLRAEIAVWERALDRCERFLVAMARLNIDERLAAISEAQAAAVIEAIGVACDAVRMPPEQRRIAISAVREHFAA